MRRFRLFVLTTHGRQLHYVRFLCGDGNFKLQRIAKRESSRSNPLAQESMLGDGSFWAPQNIHDAYLGETSIAADEPKGAVCLKFSGFWSLILSIDIGFGCVLRVAKERLQHNGWRPRDFAGGKSGA